jgi:hypothetical protein
MSSPEVAVSNEKIALDNGGGGEESDDSFTNPTGINEKSLVRRLDLKLLPPLTLLYLLSFLDRSNSMYPNLKRRI